MKTWILCFVIIAGLHTGSFSQQLYSSTVPSSRYNPGIGTAGTPKITFDDINIPSSLVEGSNTVNITKIKVGIRRISNAPATDVKLYYTPFFGDASVDADLSIPPVLLGTVSLPANGPAILTSVISLGDSLSTLFTLKTDTGTKYKGFQTFFLGISLDNPNKDNGIRLATGPGYNEDSVWVYDADSSLQRYPANFKGSPIATFNVEVFGAPASLLPVTISSFKGEQKEFVNILQWTTNNEQNNQGFEVQRSFDGNAFTAIGFIDSKPGNGNSISKNNYQFTDAKPYVENNYYRLKQVDKDGRITLSSIVSIKGSKQASLVLTNLYPNPAKSNLNLAVVAPVNSKGIVLVTDLAGKAVMKISAPLVYGTNNISLDVAKLLAGTYMVKVTSADGYQTLATKFIKQ